MEAAPAASSPRGESKIERGWRLTQVAWRLIRADRAMLTLAVLGIVSTCFFSGLVFALGGYFSHPGQSSGRLALVALIAFYPSVLASVFCNVALASAASAAFDGEHMTVREALRNAYGKRGRIAVWAAIAAFVGILLGWVAARVPLFGRIVIWLVGAAWGLATMFVIPILAMEGIGAVDALKRSVTLAKSRWGEGLTGNLAIGAWTVVVAIPLGILLGVGGAIGRVHPAVGLPMIAISLIGLMTLTAAVAATGQVFQVALYRTSLGAPVAGFPEGDLAYPFVDDPERRKEKRKSWILRIGGTILALFALLMIVFAIFHRRQEHTGAEGYWHLYFADSARTSFAIGDPVVSAGRAIGRVTTLSGEGSSTFVGFHIDPGYNSLVQTEPAFAVGPRHRQTLCFGTARECGRGSSYKPIIQLDPPAE